MNRLLLLLLLLSPFVFAQPGVKPDSGRITPEKYIELFKEAAITDMLKTGVPASITLAQGMYESDYGNSPLSKSANNHFGIKCHKDWIGDTYHQDDDAPNECFRRYEHVMESYDDHSNFLRGRERYHFLFNLEITDYKGWAHGLKKAGYATNPAYASKLIDIIERYKLYEHDVQGVKMPVNAGEMKETAATTRPSGVREEQGGPRKNPVNPERRTGTEGDERPARSVSAAPAVSANTVNGVAFVTVKKGDTWTRIARENNIELWQVLEYNDAAKNDILKENERVFIQPKKNKSETFTHTVQEGETMRYISQVYAVKLSRLYRMNELEFGTEPKPGDQLFLKRAMLFGVVL